MEITDEMVNRADSVLSRVRSGISDETIRLSLAAAFSVATRGKEARPPQPAPSVAVKALNTVAAMVGNVEHKGGGANAAKMYADMLNDIRAVVKSALSAQVQDVAGWQSMDTAPKDGTHILCICMWTKPDCKGFLGLMQVDRWNDHYSGFGRFNNESWPATHWMPLPAAPAKQEE